MTRIALLRGVNVVGRNALPMASLVRLLTGLGCSNVRTYLQSGNAVFDCPAGVAAGLGPLLSAAIQKAHGFSPRTLILGRTDVSRAVKGNPFPAARENHKVVHVYFLEARPARPDLAAMAGVAANGEQFKLAGRLFYLYTPNGFGTSKLAERAERLLGVAATARNWRTVTALLEMAGARSSAP